MTTFISTFEAKSTGQTARVYERRNGFTIGSYYFPTLDEARTYADAMNAEYAARSAELTRTLRQED
jgi:hypothetical protein